MKKVIIVGGGFAGIKCALELAKQKIDNLKVVLISDTPHFEYHAALYRVATGGSPFEVCIPLQEIFTNREVEVVKDKIIDIDISNKRLLGNSQSKYIYDYLVLAVGSETAYFDIPGLAEHAYGLKTMTDAIRLKKHLHEMFSKGDSHIVVVGAGPTGTELAAELAHYAKKLSAKHTHVDAKVRIDLIDRSNQIMGFLPNEVSERIKQRLKKMGVNIFLNESVVKEDIETVYLKDMKIKAKTLIWTAGIMINKLTSQVTEFQKAKNGRIEVDENLQAKGVKDVYIAGDLANTKYSGMAQTAIYDGAKIAKLITAKVTNAPPNVLPQKHPIYAIPVGNGWAAVFNGHEVIYGKLGWILRRLIDLKVFCTFLPFSKALAVFFDGFKLCETCEICSKADHSN